MTMELVYGDTAWRDAELAAVCLACARPDGRPPSPVELDGRRMSAAAMLRSASRGFGFDLGIDAITISTATVANSESRMLFLEGVEAGAERRWVGALSRGLITARRYDEAYEAWQTAETVEELERLGRPTAGVPLVDNGLSPPFKRLEVDRRQNPGRRIIRKGYVEAIGATMWLGPGYLEFNEFPTREALEACGFVVTILDHGVIELEARVGPFVDLTAASVQDQLRALVFPADKARPALR